MHQDWKLFAPPPSCNFRLLVRDSNGTHDIFSQVRHSKISHPFGGKGHLLLTIANLSHVFEQNTSSRNQVNGPIEEDENFAMLLHAARAYELMEGHTAPVKIILVVEEVLTGKRRVYYN